MNLFDFSFSTLGSPVSDLSAFNCGRKDINDFFRNDALDYQKELFLQDYFRTLDKRRWGTKFAIQRGK